MVVPVPRTTRPARREVLVVPDRVVGMELVVVVVGSLVPFELIGTEPDQADLYTFLRFCELSSMLI